MDMLVKHGVNISVFAPCSYNSIYIGDENYLIQARCFNKIDKLLFYYKYNKVYRKFKEEINTHEYDVLHAHSLFANGYIAYKAFKEYNIPYVVAVRNTDINVFFKYFYHLRKLGIQILDNASRIIFISESYKEKLLYKYIPQKKRRFIEEKCVILPNGIDEYFFEKKGKIKPINESKLNLVYTGRIDENKNLITTIKCCDKILKNKYDIRLTVIGDIASKRYKEIINRYDFITYLGPKNKEEIVEIYKNMDIFVMPSKHETFGLTYVEAMAQGLPVIYTRNEGFDKFFEEGLVGYPIKYNDYHEMAEKINLIASNYEAIRKNCLENCTKFNWRDIALKYMQLYKTIVNSEESR